MPSCGSYRKEPSRNVVSDPNSALKLPKGTATANQANRPKEEVEQIGSEEIWRGFFHAEEERDS